MGILSPVSTMENWISSRGRHEFAINLKLSSNENVCNRPVIESKEFYKLFPTLKWRLDQQSMTHHTAGVFLDTLKTLMAKLKVSNHIFDS
jgi:hypothetical protein